MTAPVRTREQVLEQYADDIPANVRPEFIEELVANTIKTDEVMAAAGEPPTCPSWCQSPKGHEYDSRDGETAIRDHFLSVSELVWIAQEEANLGGVVTLGPATVHVDAENLDLTADAAELLSRHLLEAAVRVKIILGELAFDEIEAKA